MEQFEEMIPAADITCDGKAMSAANTINTVTTSNEDSREEMPVNDTCSNEVGGEAILSADTTHNGVSGETILVNDTIAAISTPNGVGGIAIIRVSGPEAIKMVADAWKGKSLLQADSHSAHLGKYYSLDGSLLDECVSTLFRAPRTFTGEDVVELSLHGSKWIQREVLNDLIRRGARVADPGEFTRRAFLNGRLDLAQAEGIADLIAASSKAAHTLAISQTRGNFSHALESLREKLIEFASLLELELDFSEEDVEFADREKMLELSQTILQTIERLSASYSAGSVLKEGVPVVIAGVPNAGKSSLLNLLLNDDKAIVSDIPGTTRDTIEDTIEINGILYRFIDTAGLRESSDVVENIGIERARDRMKKARIVIWLLDPTAPLLPQQEQLNRFLSDNTSAYLILLTNKSDLLPSAANAALGMPTHTDSEDSILNISSDSIPSNPSDLWLSSVTDIGIAMGHPTNPHQNGCEMNYIPNSDSHLEGDITTDFNLSVIPSTDSHSGNPISIDSHFGKDIRNAVTSKLHAIKFSTKTGEGLDTLKQRLDEITKSNYNTESDIIVTNARHYEALIKGAEALKRAIAGIESGISGDFIAQDVREALHHLGTITGAITTPTLLQSIFTRFCVGK